MSNDETISRRTALTILIVCCLVFGSVVTSFGAELNPRVPVVLSTDVGNEIDDQWAVVYLLLQPKFEVLGVMSAHAPTITAPAGRTSACGGRALGRPPPSTVPAGHSRQGLCDCPHSRLDRPLELRGRDRHAGGHRARHRRLRRDRGGHALSELSFEDAQRELETIVHRLESGEASLDEAITLWERGEQLYAVCSSKLDAAQGRIEELARRVEAVKP